MRTCPACGLDVEDSYLFCPDDGSRLVDWQAADATPPTAATPVDAPATRVEGGPSQNDAVVLYCGECAAEYPMTFVECPVHHCVLMSYKIQPLPPALPIPPESDPIVDLPISGEDSDPVDESPFAGVPSAMAVQQPLYPEQVAAGGKEGWRSVRGFAAAASGNPTRESRSWAPSIFGVDSRAEDDLAREPGSESRFENPSFRIVAASLVVALALFCVGAVYIFFSGGARRQTAARAAQIVQAAQVQEPQPLIPTPAEALDYKQESAAVAPASPATLDSALAEQPGKHVTEKTTFPAAAPRTPGIVRPTPVSMERPVSAPPKRPVIRPSITEESHSARVVQGRVDARLIRIRSMRTASGVRYDLTFDLQDESGRHAQWERMQISTRSASGVSHSQAIPFVHRLGASGALTFTVSVEMRGQSQADWQGRVVCTTTGSDNDGKPLRASFGTNVTP